MFTHFVTLRIESDLSPACALEELWLAVEDYPGSIDLLSETVQSDGLVIELRVESELPEASALIELWDTTEDYPGSIYHQTETAALAA